MTTSEHIKQIDSAIDDLIANSKGKLDDLAITSYRLTKSYLVDKLAYEQKNTDVKESKPVKEADEKEETSLDLA